MVAIRKINRFCPAKNSLLTKRREDRLKSHKNVNSVPPAEKVHNEIHQSYIPGFGRIPTVRQFNPGIQDFRIEKLIIEKREDIFMHAPFPDNYTYPSEAGLRLKPHIYISQIKVKPEFLRQGVCKEIEKKIVKLSKKLGCEGRVILTSAKIRECEDRISNPSIAHWKNGFRFAEKELNDEMKRIVEFNAPIRFAPLGDMYYPVK